MWFAPRQRVIGLSAGMPPPTDASNRKFTAMLPRQRKQLHAVLRDQLLVRRHHMLARR